MHVEHVDSEFYRLRLENALRMTATSSAAALGETAHLLELLLTEAAPALDLTELERQVRDATDLDLKKVRDVAGQVLGLRPAPVPLKDEATINPDEEARKLEEALNELAKQHVLASNVAWFHLEFRVDGRLTRLLICAANSGLRLDSVVATAREKLANVDEISLVRLWSQIQREFDEMREARFDPNSPVLPPNFLDLTPAEELRAKIARYVMELKPKLVAERIATAVYTHPSDAIGPSRLLAFNTSSTPLERDVLRLDLARSIGRISAAWSSVLSKKLETLAALLGLEPETRLLQGPEVKAAQKELSESKEPAAAAVHEALAFLATIERFGAARSGVEEVLRRHKLGLEVTLPDSAKDLRGCSELLLQKRLARFLIDQGVYAEGTKFGPFEADLLANVRAMATVLEVKLYAARNRPTVKSIQSNLAQLQDYMDKRPVRPRGALVVYNLSDVMVVAPNRWIRGRYWISVINLGARTGSARRATLTLDEDYSDKLIVGTSNDATPAGGVKRRKKGAKPTKKEKGR